MHTSSLLLPDQVKKHWISQRNKPIPLILVTKWRICILHPFKSHIDIWNQDYPKIAFSIREMKISMVPTFMDLQEKFKFPNDLYTSNLPSVTFKHIEFINLIGVNFFQFLRILLITIFIYLLFFHFIITVLFRTGRRTWYITARTPSPSCNYWLLMWTFLRLQHFSSSCKTHGSFIDTTMFWLSNMW